MESNATAFLIKIKLRHSLGRPSRSDFVQAGFVKSVRGPQGGYLLKKTPEEYTVGMILRQTEGDLMSLSSDTSNEMEKASVINRVWDKMGKAVNDIVDNITLQDLLDWEEEQTEEAGFYVI